MKAGMRINRRGVKFWLYREPNMETDSLFSRTVDGKHVLFLDYDRTALELVRDELRILIGRYKLTSFYLFRSSEPRFNASGVEFGNYHAICLDRMTMRRVRMIQEDSSCDSAHMMGPRYNVYKTWVLRAFPKLIDGKEASPKPVYLESVSGERKVVSNGISSGHKLYLIKNYGIPCLDEGVPDGFTEVYGCPYNDHDMKGGLIE